MQHTSAMAYNISFSRRRSSSTLQVRALEALSVTLSLAFVLQSINGSNESIDPRGDKTSGNVACFFSYFNVFPRCPRNDVVLRLHRYD